MGAHYFSIPLNIGLFNGENSTVTQNNVDDPGKDGPLIQVSLDLF